MEVLSDNFLISRRFCGPPQGGNGGYVAGILSRYLSGPVQVRFNELLPLEVPLKIIRTPEDKVQLLNGTQVLAEAQSTEFQTEIPALPSFQEAKQASHHYLGFREHDYPTCFVCGPKRTQKDGLRIFPGWVLNKNLVAAPWVPDSTLDDGNGRVKPEFMWAALDCPGAFAMMGNHFERVLLGTLTAEIRNPVEIGQSCLAIGWPVTQEGRKHFVGTAVFNQRGELAGRAKGIWVETVRDIHFKNRR